MDPLSLDWGGATAEFQNDEAKSAVHIFNHDLTAPDRVERAIRFAQARLAWCARKMPGFTQEVWYDEREQKVAPESKQQIRTALGTRAAGLMFMSEGGE
ncbi:MAG: hypothetical protein HY293_02465 [Planctomycetes bacterium]|nr:hypothetical protein [Planctomycetota bacterium]